MNRTITAAVAGIIVLVLILFNTTFTVNFHELAVTTRLGREAGIVREPGLHFKLPLGVDQADLLQQRADERSRDFLRRHLRLAEQDILPQRVSS